MSVLDIILKIKNTASTNSKKDILTENIDNVDLKRAIQLALEPSIVSGVKKLPDAIETDKTLTLSEGLDALDALYTRKVTGNAARQFLGELFGSVSEDDAEVLRKVVLKNLDCGVQEKNANDVYGKGFIKDEPYMRCSLVNEKTVQNITSFKTHGYAVAEVKMDGQYLNSAVVNDSLLCTSRNGKVYDFLGMKDADMVQLAKNVQALDSRFESGVVFNGECLVIDNDGKILNRETGNGIIQKAGKDSISPQEAIRVVFVLWDVLPFDAFKDGLWDVERKERRELLENAISTLESEFVRMVEYVKCIDIGQAFDFNTEMIEKGEEGSILKCESGIWKSHTSPKQLKLKLKMQFDLRVIGYNPGEGKRAGGIGSLILESADGIIVVGCGTGFKEKDAEWTPMTMMERWNEIDGAIVTAESTSLTKDKRTGKMSIFLPVFVEFRFDKNTADTYERILEIKESAVHVLREKLAKLEC
jgi:ATP-dependent DNA ligase